MMAPSPIISPVKISVENLKVPDVIRDIPYFDGNPNLLHDFINRVDYIMQFMPIKSNDPQNFVNLNAIRSKIIGSASEFLSQQGCKIDWAPIKTHLLNRYADARDENALMKELFNFKQNSSSLQDYYFKINEILAKLINCLNNETDELSKITKRKIFQKSCLNVFIRGLYGALGGDVFAMRPDTLECAYKFANELQEFHQPRKTNNSNNNYQNNNNDFNYRYNNCPKENYYVNHNNNNNQSYRCENQNFSVEASTDPPDMEI